MCCSKVWDEENLSFEQLPTLQELLRCCDEKLLVRTVVEDHQRQEAAAATVKQHKEAKKRLARALATMRTLPVDSPSRAAVLLPEEVFVLHADSGLIERRIVASLVFVEDEEVARRALVGEDCITSLEPRSYALVPWEASLAYRVHFDGPWCLCERYQILASAFWELTFFGFEYDRAAAHQAQKKAERVMGAAKSAPPKDRTSCARAYGLEVPDRFTEERREALARRVGALNQASRRDFYRRFLTLTNEVQAA